MLPDTKGITLFSIRRKVKCIGTCIIKNRTALHPASYSRHTLNGWLNFSVSSPSAMFSVYSLPTGKCMYCGGINTISVNTVSYFSAGYSLCS